MIRFSPLLCPAPSERSAGLLQIQPQIHRIPVLAANADIGQRRARAAVVENLLNNGQIHAGRIRPVTKRYLVKYFTTSYISLCCT